MAYDEKLAARIRKLFADDPRYSERKMFGGVCFMLNGHMCCGTAAGKLMVRVGPDAYDACLAMPHASPMTFTGKALKGYVYVEPAGVARGPGLLKWVTRGADFVASLPPKAARKGA